MYRHKMSQLPTIQVKLLIWIEYIYGQHEIRKVVMNFGIWLWIMCSHRVSLVCSICSQNQTACLQVWNLHHVTHSIRLHLDCSSEKWEDKYKTQNKNNRINKIILMIMSKIKMILKMKKTQNLKKRLQPWRRQRWNWSN